MVNVAKGKYDKWLTEDGLLKLTAWARDGLTDEQIAHNCGITTSTLYEWKNKYSSISESLKRGKEVADIVIENALYLKATGFTYEEESAFKIKHTEYSESGKKISETESIETVTLNKYCPPDTTAQIFWLKNRKPQQWRDAKQLEHDGNIQYTFAEVSAVEADEIMG
jgi:transcriptional regulator with XRE-family HTH domain